MHGLIEAAKRALRVRDRAITDPDRLQQPPERFLANAFLDAEAAAIDRGKAGPWPAPHGQGDTIWMGAADASRPCRVLHPVALLGIRLRRGAAAHRRADAEPRHELLARAPSALNALEPGRLPLHTLNPALAVLRDGRVMAYGTMGGDAQPQIQAALFTRHVSVPPAARRGARPPALVHRPHLGLGARQRRAGRPLRRQPDRPADVRRP